MDLDKAQQEVIHAKRDGNRFVNLTIEESLCPKLSGLGLRTTMSTPPALGTPEPRPHHELPPGLRAAPITPRDVPRTLDFLRARFFRDEPLNKAVKLLENDGDTCTELEDYCGHVIDEGISTMLLDERDAIVGVGLYGLTRRNEKIEDDSVDCGDPKFKKILQLLYKVNVESDIFAKLPDVDVVLDVKIISVDEAYRGQGLGHYLLWQAKEAARQSNVSVIRSECSSYFTAKVMMKLGSTKIYTLKYADYKIDGETVFVPEPPHTEISIYYYRY